MQHFIERCECGIVLQQCRCPGPKTEITSRPCTHRSIFDEVLRPFSGLTVEVPYG